MTVRTKTIEYAFTQYVTSLASATRYDFGAITIYIPETTSRNFRSVVVEVTCMDNVTIAASMTANLLGIKLGAVAFTDTSHTVTITNSGEQVAYHFQIDVAAYFNTNFGSGSSQTCQVGVMFTGPSTINHTAKLIITYDYDDAATTRIKTVRIPLDSGTGALTASLAEIGTNQVPLLNTYLPEASKTFRDMFFQIEGNEDAAGTTDFQHACSLDAEAEVLDGLHEQGLQSSRWWRRIWKRTDMTTSAVHAFKMRVTNVAGGTCNHLSIVLVVTYEYDHSASTSIINSIAMPFCVAPAETSGIAAGDKDTIQVKFFIEEPTTITLVQSGIMLNWLNDAASDLAVLCGTQSARTYTDPASVYCGGISCTHRIDSGGGAGVGITLARGEVTFTISVYSSVANVRHGAVDGVLLLNYTSGKHASGDGVHNHTIIWALHVKNANLNLVQLATVQPQIPESNYWVTQMGYVAYANKDTTGINNQAVCSLEAERGAGEGPASGFEILGWPEWGYTDLESGVCVFAKDCSKYFDRHIGEVDTGRLVVEASRSWALKVFKSVCASQLYITYHVIPYTVAGTVSGYTGDGSGIAVSVHRADTHEKVMELTTAAGGGFTGTWFDNVVALYAHCRQDATHVGRSEQGVAA